MKIAKSVRYQTYDLHELYKPAAKAYLYKILNDWKQAERKYEFIIITGKGIHSRNGPVVRPLTIDILNAEQFRFSADDAGVVYVYGKRKPKHN